MAKSNLAKIKFPQHSKTASEWIQVDSRNIDTYPPMHRRIEIVTKPRALYQHSECYVHCWGERISVNEVSVVFGRSQYKVLGWLAMEKWRLA